MKLTDIYKHGRVRLGRDWVSSMKATIAEATPAATAAGVAIFRVPFGGQFYAYPSVTEPSSSEYGFTEPMTEALIKAGLMAPAGELPIAVTHHGMDVPCGVILVTGPGDAGKSPFAYALADAICEGDEAGFGLLRYGEPFTGYGKSQARAGHELASLMVGHRAVVIDSVKDLLSDMEGAATKSGITRKAISMLSRLSIVASEVGCAVIIPVNPSSSDTAVGDLMAEVARSNVAMAAINEGDKWAMVTRTGEGRMRAKGVATLKFKDDIPSLSFQGVEASETQIESVLTVFESKVTPDDFDYLTTARRLAARSN